MSGRKNTPGIILVLTALCLVAVSWGVLRAREAAHAAAVEAVEQSLRGLSASARVGLEGWLAREMSTAAMLAEREAVVEAALELSALPPTPSALEAAPIQAHLRETLRIHEFGYQGYFIVSRDNINLASTRATNLGVTNLLVGHGDFFERIHRGETAVSEILPSDVPLERSGKLKRHQPTLFAGAPIHGADGEILGALLLRLDHRASLNETAVNARIGETGETYAVDREGRLLTESRFLNHLAMAGLISPHEVSATGLRVLDPGRDLTLEPGEVPREGLPLTDSTAAVVQEQGGARLAPYRDYRGVPVIGVWTWFEPLGIGLITEQDAAEAFTPFYKNQRIIETLGAATFALILGLGLLGGLSLRQLDRLNEGLEARVLARTAEAREAVSAKSEFLARMSHDIRNPMGAVTGLLEILLSEEVPPETQRAYIRRAHSAATLLIELLNDILDLERITAGKLEIHPEAFRLMDVLSPLGDIVSARCAGGAVDFALTVAHDVPEGISADRLRLTQVLVNLVSNAAKFTERGQIAVRVRRSAGEGGERLQFEVSDTGCGFPPELGEQLMQPFVQAGHSVTRQHGGSGLGLAICQQLVQAMGGQIAAESAEGQGATFRFHLPLVAAAIASREAQAHAGKPLADYELLVVDDADVNLLICRAVLEAAGARVHTAGSGEAALACLEAHSPDLIFLDLHMPGMDGFQVARLLRERGVHTPIVSLSASTFASELKDALDAGMNAHAAKPIDRRQLVAVTLELVPSPAAQAVAEAS